VPIQQAEEMVGRLKAAGVPAKLVVKRGAGHGWKGLEKDMAILADWFDRYLRAKGPQAAPAPESALAERPVPALTPEYPTLPAPVRAGEGAQGAALGHQGIQGGGRAGARSVHRRQDEGRPVGRAQDLRGGDVR